MLRRGERRDSVSEVELADRESFLQQIEDVINATEEGAGIEYGDEENSGTYVCVRLRSTS